MEVKATAKAVGLPPQKVRLVVDTIRGRKAEEALALLRFVPGRAARAVSKVVKSAVANAENNLQMAPADLRIVRIQADEGPRLKRIRAQARGRVSPILKRSTHITVVVDEVS